MKVLRHDQLVQLSPNKHKSKRHIFTEMPEMAQNNVLKNPFGQLDIRADRKQFKVSTHKQYELIQKQMFQNITQKRNSVKIIQEHNPDNNDRNITDSNQNHDFNIKNLQNTHLIQTKKASLHNNYSKLQELPKYSSHAIQDTLPKMDLRLPKSFLSQVENKTSNQNLDLYEILSIAGTGTFGTVLKVKNKISQQLLAIKKVLQDPKFKNRELGLLKSLNHPNIIRLYSSFYQMEGNQQFLYLVMDYMPENLYQMAKSSFKKNSIPISLLKLYFYQIFRGINYLHQSKIIHRDIKPQNVLVDKKTNKVVICDFGSAKQLVQNEPNISYICSRSYRAPELILGATNYQYKVDIWSVGCVMAEIINGKPIFYGNNNQELFLEIVKCLGVPTKDDIIEMSPQSEILTQGHFKSRDIGQILQTNDQQLIDLLRNIFVFSPKQRYDAISAMTHPFFNELRDRQYLKELENQVGNIPDLFDFSQLELKGNENLRTLLLPYNQAKFFQ